jgi:hypothetical protein
MRERWFGATGRKVPEIALEGTIDLDRIRAAHVEGTPVVVRATTAEGVLDALSHGEVACALVRDPELLEVDLTRLTYG